MIKSKAALAACLMALSASAAAANAGTYRVDGETISLHPVYAYGDANDQSVAIVFADRSAKLAGDIDDQFYLDTLEHDLVANDHARVLELRLLSGSEAKLKYMTPLKYPGEYPDDPYRVTIERMDGHRVAGRFTSVDAQHNSAQPGIDLEFDVPIHGSAIVWTAAPPSGLHLAPPPPPPPPSHR